MADLIDEEVHECMDARSHSRRLVSFQRTPILCQKNKSVDSLTASTRGAPGNSPDLVLVGGSLSNQKIGLRLLWNDYSDKHAPRATASKTLRVKAPLCSSKPSLSQAGATEICLSQVSERKCETQLQQAKLELKSQ